MEEYKSILQADESYRYQMLGRLQRDCEYYLGNGSRSKRVLWALDEEEQIALMKKLWKTFSKEGKPVWCTWDTILGYESAMVCK